MSGSSGMESSPPTVDLNSALELKEWVLENCLISRRPPPGWHPPEWPESFKPLKDWAWSHITKDSAHFGTMSDEQFRAFRESRADIIFKRQYEVMTRVVQDAHPEEIPDSDIMRVITGLGGVSSDLDTRPASERAIAQLTTKTVKSSDEAVHCAICDEEAQTGEQVTFSGCRDGHIVRNQQRLQLILNDASFVPRHELTICALVPPGMSHCASPLQEHLSLLLLRG